MLTIKDWMELVDYRITEGSDFCWSCYGFDAYSLDSWNGIQDGHSFTIIFDTKTQTVYELQAHDYRNNRAYRMINPMYNTARISESEQRGVGLNVAWDGVDYIDLEVDSDYSQKVSGIINGEDYDTRVSVPVDFTDEELLKYMTMAHERDMTFNQFVEEALKHAILEFERDPKAMQDKAEQWKKDHTHYY